MNKQKYYEAPRLRYAMSCILSVLVVAFMIALPGCAQKEAPPEPQIPAHFTTYNDEAGLFSISYPPDWELALSIIEDLEQATKELVQSIESDAPIERASIIFFAGVPVETGWIPSVNIVVESLPGLTWTHDEAVEAEVRGIKQIYPDYRQLSRTDTTIDGRKATIIDCEATIPGFGKAQQLQMFTLVGKIVWAVTCTPEPGRFSESEEDFYAIVRSLRILK